MRIKFKKKLNKNTIITTSVIVFFALILTPRLTYANGFTDVICNMISAVIAFIADGIVYLCDALGGKFDKLIFNYDGNDFNSDLNLMILKKDTISKQILSLYGVMQYIGSGILITIGGWITMDFLRAAEDARHKAVLKSRLEKLVLAMFLLNSLPIVVDVMLAFNYAITDAFRLISKSIVSDNSSIDYGKSFLTEMFKKMIDKATGKEAFILSLAYLIAAFINVWLIIFYMIRDLAIAFLLIFAPIMVCLLPYRVDLLVSWFKEMFSNIITQAFQAFVFLVILVIASGLTEKSELHSDMFALVAFAMFIPITAMLKRMIGLEGNVGVAKSTAGLGAAVMTLALAGKAMNGARNQAGVLKDSYDRVKGLKSERDNLDKIPRAGGSSPLSNLNFNGMNGSRGNYGGLATGMAALGGMEGAAGEMGTGMAMASMFTGGGRSAIKGGNSWGGMNFPRDRNMIQGEINSIRKQAIKSLAGGTLSAIGGGAMAIGGSGLGPMGTFAGLQFGTSMGEAMGSLAGGGMYNLGADMAEKGQDIMYGEGIRPELSALDNGNKRWNSLDNIKYNMSNMKKNMSDNIEAMKSDMNYGYYNERKSKYLSDDMREQFNINKTARQDEMTGLTGDPLRDTKYYENEKDSRLQTQSLIRQGKFAQASRHRLQTSSPSIDKEAVKGLEGSVINNTSEDNAMLYTDKNSSILFKQNFKTGDREVLATFPGNPNLETPTMEDVSFNANGDIPVSDMQRSHFREQARNMAISKFGADSLDNPDNEYFNAAGSFIDKETNNLINQHVVRNEHLRRHTGSSKMFITGGVDHVNVSEYNTVPNDVGDINITVPDSLNTQHQRDVFSNIKSSDINLSRQHVEYVYDKASKQAELMAKQVEYAQQRQYTENLMIGANEIHYRNYNDSNKTSNGNLM